MNKIDIRLAIEALIVFFVLLTICIRYVRKEQRSKLACKCKSSKLVKYEGAEFGKEFSCITEKGIRKQVKNVYQCKSCGRITIEIN